MKAKRSLGQNFFVNENLGNYIINAVKETKCGTVVEIGPGIGFFTKKLSNVFSTVIVVEKDKELANTLKLEIPTVKVINADFLEFNLESLPQNDLLFFGSLPFNVSKPIVRKVIENKVFKNKSFFIVQKEVAEKYLYKHPYSTLSLTTALYAQTKKVIDISRDSFRPKPNVTSTLISFSPLEKDFKNKKEMEKLITLSFKQPRKKIYNNLKKTKYKKGALLFKELRPSQLSLDEYTKILNHSLF